MLKKVIALVFQSFHLFPHYSILRNITETPIHVLKISREEAESTACRLLIRQDPAAFFR